jgi:hypothetical protein
MPIFSAPSFSRRISSGYKRKFFGILIGGFKDVVRIGIPCLYERFQRVYNYYYCMRKFLPFCLVYTAFPSGFLCIHSVARPCFVYENRGGTPKQYPPRNETE